MPVLTVLQVQQFAVVSKDCGGSERKIRKVRLSLTFRPLSRASWSVSCFDLSVSGHAVPR